MQKMGKTHKDASKLHTSEANIITNSFDGDICRWICIILEHY